MARRCLPFVALLLFAAGGFAPAAEDAPVTTPYFPLAVGSKWFYKCGENHYRFEVVKFEKVGDTNCARMETFVNDKSRTAENVAVTKEGVKRFTFDGKKAEPAILFLKLPVPQQPVKGKDGKEQWEKWEVKSKVDGQEIKGSFTSGVEENVKVPAGTFTTATVTGENLEANGVKLSLKYYFAKDVGMVKQVMEVAGQKIVIELEKYEPGKK